MKKVLFLDRDGVINSDVGLYYVYKPGDFLINRGIIEGLQWLKSKGFEFVVITNQGGIARGTYTKADVELVHAKLKSELAAHQISLLEIYYCPHHSDLEKCLCRKPGSLMIEKAAARFGINLSQSYFIGDNQKDMQAAKNAGVTGIYIESNQNINVVLSKIQHE
jgi:D-glycero-D-manno-heptose 1,7-bisphosphate phosphatase